MGDHNLIEPTGSMRPPEFTGGNLRRMGADLRRGELWFNEAAGIHRRKPGDCCACPVILALVQ